ncbi:MAG: diaminopimelate epimerase, partial [Rhodospirillaceae bacterium]
MAETGRDGVVIETRAGRLEASRRADGRITVNMGLARSDWREIPLAVPADTYCLEVAHGSLSGPVAVSMGNPHAVFFVADVDTVLLAEVGPVLEHHPLFPERTNVEVVQVLGSGRLRMRVWERGAGITSACGTGACAALVAAVRRGLCGRSAEVVLDGGVLEVAWHPDGHVFMTGPVATSFSGRLAPGLLST